MAYDIESLYTNYKTFNLINEVYDSLTEPARISISLLRNIRRDLIEYKYKGSSFSLFELEGILLDLNYAHHAVELIISAISRYLNGVEELNFLTIEQFESQISAQDMINDFKNK